jgi:NAD(P)-dependent dehydrogenase (short-subunit alcohol dehydrogenase family)
LVETTLRFFGPADVVINNAIRIASVPVLEMDEAVWDQILAVNLRGTFLTCKAFLPDMIARGSGVLINMVSVDAMPGLSAYIASKQGIVGLSQSLALEVEPSGIQVIPFAPGMVDTPGIRSVAADLAPRLGMTQEQFLKLSLHAAYDGLMPPEHAGVATVYLALHLAKEFHGQVVNGYEVLERAGFLNTGPVDMPATEINGAAAVIPVKTAPGESSPCILEVQEILLQTAAEFEKLPAFVRPIARNGFKGKAGASLDDWQRSLSALKARLEASRLPEDEASAFITRLKKLITYFQGVPVETARFTRDKAMLAEVSRLTAARIAVIQRLMDALTTPCFCMTAHGTSSETC